MRNRETNKQKDIREDDLFYDYFKNNLMDHQMPVEEQNWDKIYSRVNPHKRRPFWIALYSSAAAAVILFFILLGTGSGNQENEVKLSDNNKFIAGKNISKKQQSTLSENTNINNDLYSQGSHSANSKKEQIIATNNIGSHPATNLNKIDSVVEGENNTEVLSTDVSNESAEIAKVSESSERTKDSTQQVKTTKSFDLKNDTYDDNLLAYEPKKHSKWEISAELGTSKLKSESQGYNDRIMLAVNSICYTGEAFMGINNNNPEVAEFAPPFSIGLLARKKINSIFSIETGLTYSYLSTSFKDNDMRYYKANLSLHYLGIPINLVAGILNINDIFKVYVSAGPMAEKGLESDFTERNSIIGQTAKDVGSIKGIQWSANASVGISYKIINKLNLYLEPQISYFFDNNQPTSIRTEKRTIIGINSGFRFDL